MLEVLQSILANSTWDSISVAISFVALIFFVLTERERIFFWRKPSETISKVSYKEKMERLASSLSSASSEVDKILEEMEMVARHREESLKVLDTKLAELSTREQEMKAKVESLEKIPLPAIEHFLQETEKGEKRSATRDYILFIAGTLVSALISIILKLIFNI